MSDGVALGGRSFQCSIGGEPASLDADKLELESARRALRLSPTICKARVSTPAGYKFAQKGNPNRPSRTIRRRDEVRTGE